MTDALALFEQTGDHKLLPQIHTHCIVCGEVVPREREAKKAITCTDEHAKIRHAQIKRGDRSGRCVICTDELSAERTMRGALTCGLAHGRIRRNKMYSNRDGKRCKFCRKPSTPIERAAYRRFRQLELTRPDLLYPAAFKAFGGSIADFAAALAASFRAKELAGDDSPGEFDLGLIDRRHSSAPGGARSGKPRLEWTGGDPEKQPCEHEPKRQRPGAKKKLTWAERNKCRRCGANRVGAEEEPSEGEREQDESGGVSAPVEVGQDQPEGTALQDH